MKAIVSAILFSIILKAQVIGAWHTPTPPSWMITDSTSIVLVEFNKAADSISIMTASNYLIKDNSGSYPVQAISWVTSIDNIQVIYTRLIALKVPKLRYRKDIEVNYKTEKYYFWENGFADWKFSEQSYFIRK